MINTGRAVNLADWSGRPNMVFANNSAYSQADAVRIIETPLTSEKEAQRLIDLAASRYWRVTNPTMRNVLDEPVGYRLVPGANALPFLDPESPVGRRAGFMYRHFWASRYQADELYPAGRYPNQHPGGDGLPRWTDADRSLEDQRIVVWYTLGVTHIPRTEDWPIMPVHPTGFRLVPAGFFSQNPGLGVAATGR